METIQQNTLIEDLAAATAGVLKKAFARHSGAIAARFSELGKPIGARTVRKMTEPSADVKRRNILENTVLLLAASRRQSLRAFETVWMYLESVAGFLRGRVTVYPTLDRQVSEFRFAAASAERAFFSGNTKEFEQALIFVDEALRGVFIKLRLID